MAAEYGERLASLDVTPPTELPPAHHVYHQFTLRIAGGRRDAVREKLAAEGISSVAYYPVPLHRMPIYAALELDLPEAERAASEVLSLPIWPALDSVRIERVVAALAAALS